jgi:hypothetical protein
VSGAEAAVCNDRSEVGDVASEVNSEKFEPCVAKSEATGDTDEVNGAKCEVSVAQS